MAFCGKDGRQEERVRLAAQAGARGVGRSRDQPMRLACAPMGGLGSAPLGQMQPICSGGKDFVVRHQENKISPARYRQQIFYQSDARRRAAGPRHHQTAKGQSRSCRQRVGQALFVGKQRQSRPG